MNGTWKENISGYDRKGLKRKKQNRKHTLKDKAKWHIRNSIHNGVETDALYVEGDVEIKPLMVKNHRELYVDIWNIDVDNYEYSNTSEYFSSIPPAGLFEGKNKIAFKYKNGWYDIYTYEYIKGIIKPLIKIDTMYLDWDENKPKMVEYRGWCISATNETIFLYNKPLPRDFWNIFRFRFRSSTIRKWAQKKAHHIDRQNVRAYISKGEWDKEIKTHATSKSIAWEID